VGVCHLNLVYRVKLWEISGDNGLFGIHQGMTQFLQRRFWIGPVIAKGAQFVHSAVNSPLGNPIILGGGELLLTALYYAAINRDGLVLIIFDCLFIRCVFPSVRWKSVTVAPLTSPQLQRIHETRLGDRGIFRS